jgi:hypothetical protein
MKRFLWWTTHNNPYWGEAACVETLLWDMVTDGRPFNVLIVYLPMCSPELKSNWVCLWYFDSSDLIIQVPAGRTLQQESCGHKSKESLWWNGLCAHLASLHSLWIY